MRRGGQGAERFVLIDPPASAHLHWRHVYQLCFIMGWMAALPFPIPGILNIQAGGVGGRGQGEKGRGGRGYEMFVDYFHWSIWPELGNRKWKQTAANGTWLDSLCVCVCVCVSVCVCVCVSRRLSSVIGSVSWSISAATETVERKRLLNGWLINGTGNWIMEACGMTSSAHAGLTKRTWRTDQREGGGGGKCGIAPCAHPIGTDHIDPESRNHIFISASPPLDSIASDRIERRPIRNDGLGRRGFFFVGRRSCCHLPSNATFIPVPPEGKVGIFPFPPPPSSSSLPPSLPYPFNATDWNASAPARWSLAVVVPWAADGGASARPINLKGRVSIQLSPIWIK